MKKHLIFLSFIFGILLTNGCATTENFYEGYKKVVDPPIDWKQQAEFYRDNYPGCTSNEKARMLADSMSSNKQQFNIDKKVYRVEVLHLYIDGRKIWPVDKTKSKKRFDYSEYIK